ncbi:hypothetical protein PS15m_011548 [Mucor circinelloides]
MSYAYTVRQVAMPIVLLSTTVPPKMESQLKVNYASNFVTIRSSTTCREEIMYSVVLREDQETMQEELINTLESCMYASSCVIVYIQNRASCEMLQEMFETKYPQAISCIYHATLTPEQKVAHQEAFMQETDKCKLMFATSAFAMGIDIPNIKAIINYGDMPDSLLDYAQASDRVKRDSNSFVGPAEAIIITTLDSIDNFIEFRMRNATKKEEKDKGEDLQEMKIYITTTSCRRYILQAKLDKLGTTCFTSNQLAKCDNCLMQAMRTDDAVSIEDTDVEEEETNDDVIEVKYDERYAEYEDYQSHQEQVDVAVERNNNTRQHYVSTNVVHSANMNALSELQGTQCIQLLLEYVDWLTNKCATCTLDNITQYNNSSAGLNHGSIEECYRCESRCYKCYIDHCRTFQCEVFK